MKKNVRITGYSYQLRPVNIEDAGTIIDIRLQDAERNKYIHRISEDVAEQINWLNAYLERDNDYYFVIENIFTGEAEGLISIYDMVEKRAEWGRWVLKKGSMASIESVYLIMKIAFEKLNLKMVYSRTIEKNTSVVSFHDSINEMRRGVLEDYVLLNGESCNAIEHFVDKDLFYEKIEPQLQAKSLMVFKRNIESAIKDKLVFHHIGVATADLKKELGSFYMLGYRQSSEIFDDEIQGIKGCFLEAKGQPCIELLENLSNSTTLNRFLETNCKMYHLAYCVNDIERTSEILQKCRAKVLSGCQLSIYFKKRICFLVLQNKLIIELIER